MHPNIKKDDMGCIETGTREEIAGYKHLKHDIPEKTKLMIK